ncbi:hypothetical protein [Acinetobacter baumannii]|nr:hypothetical protein [Acinetobacter baumannii]
MAAISATLCTKWATRSPAAGSCGCATWATACPAGLMGASRTGRRGRA